MTMMDPPRGETPLKMTEGMNIHSIRREPVVEAAEQPTPPTDKNVRTPASSREKQSNPVQLHREENQPAPGPLRETATACKQACRGVAYDLKHWKQLPAATTTEKIKMVATRGGRLPYLVLTISVAFLVFFMVIHFVKWLGGGGGRRSARTPFVISQSGNTGPIVGRNNMPAATTNPRTQ